MALTRHSPPSLKHQRVVLILSNNNNNNSQSANKHSLEIIRLLLLKSWRLDLLESFPFRTRFGITAMSERARTSISTTRNDRDCLNANASVCVCVCKCIEIDFNHKSN